MRGAQGLKVQPELCGRCGKCMRACPGGHLRVGGGYIYVDTSACDGCLKCTHVCESGAISARSAPGRPHLAGGAASDGAKVIVGSRAEAKALRKAAEAADKTATARAKSQSKAESSAAVQAKRKETVANDGTVAWGLTDAGIVVGVFFATVALQRFALASRAVSLMPEDGQLLFRSLLLLVLFGVRLGALAFVAHRNGSTIVSAFGLGRLGRSWSHRATTMWAVLAGLVLTRTFSALWGAATKGMAWYPSSSSELTQVFGVGAAGVITTVVLVVIAGPVVEELAFRGVVLSAAGERMGMWPAIAVSAALFSASHATLWAAVPLAVLGGVAGWLAWNRCSLWPAIALHALYNGVVVAGAFWLVR